MAESFNSMRRYGARYGRSIKDKFGKIEAEQRKKHICPYCRAKQAKRLAVGIWHCLKCRAKFTGKAYSVEKKITFEEEARREETPKAEA
ncbi:50S ribosomal protein L37ae [Candidatus Woesearchaeota archaeon]|nr:50S ribosomal protein L37ae [Candidatus Woesearchaeota archaeon]